MARFLPARRFFGIPQKRLYRVIAILAALAVAGGVAGAVNLATYSNLNAAPGYARHAFNLGRYIGQTITVKFTGAEDYGKQTSFVIDDTAINTT